MTTVKESVLAARARGDFHKAVSQAQRWTRREPDNVLSWCTLADAHSLVGSDSQALQALQRAQVVNPHHPMYFRSVCYSAVAAGQATTAHGACTVAQITGLPTLIVRDLKAHLIDSQVILNDQGQFPASAPEDPAWRALLPLLWRMNLPRSAFVWAEYQGRCYLFHEALVELAQACALGRCPSDWPDRYPDARALLERLGDAMGAGELPTPAQLSPRNGLFLLFALQFVGCFSEPIATDTVVASCEDHWLAAAMLRNDSVVMADHPVLLARLATILPHLLEGRYRLRGPDAWLQAALPWLLQDFECRFPGLQAWQVD